MEAFPATECRGSRGATWILDDLWHSYASRALALGEGLPVIAKLLGHSHIQTTARYAHLARHSVREAAERVADAIAEDLLEGAGSSCPK